MQSERFVKVCEVKTAHIFTGSLADREGMYCPGLFPIVK